METLILPGFSPKNKEWAHWAKDGLSPKTPTIVLEWRHWETGNAETGWIEKETQKVVDMIGERQVNILAKSIGTLVAMNLLKLKPDSVNKLILCGIPLNDLEEGDNVMYEVLREFAESRFLCIQNQDDNHGSYAEAEKFLHAINPKLKIISKPSDNHEYPYLEEFLEVLRST